MSEIEKKRSRARQRGARYSLLLAHLRLIGCLYHAFFCPCRHCQKMNQLGIYSVDTITTNHIFFYTREFYNFYILIVTFDVNTIIFLNVVFIECAPIKFNYFYWLVTQPIHAAKINEFLSLLTCVGIFVPAVSTYTAMHDLYTMSKMTTIFSIKKPSMMLKYGRWGCGDPLNGSGL